MQTTNNQPQQYRVRINKYIRAPQVRVILADGSNGGIMDTQDALRMAREQGMDLIELNSKVNPIITKICDYGKFKYEERKKQQSEKKKQTVQELKELTMRPASDYHDIDHKLVKARGFLEQNNRVKISLRFRGRELAHQDIGREKIEYCLQQLSDLIQPNPIISMEGKILSVLISPIKKS